MDLQVLNRLVLWSSIQNKLQVPAGDGRYYLLDSAEAANESFAAQIAGALRPSAPNVKVQVEFNPQRVGRYNLMAETQVDLMSDVTQILKRFTAVENQPVCGYGVGVFSEIKSRGGA